TGQPILPRVDKVTYEDAVDDLKTEYRTSGSRDLEEAGWRLRHLDAYFAGYRLPSIGPAGVTRYIDQRQKAGASNGTINREIAILGRMLRLAYANGKLLRVPVFPKKPKESAPRAGFFERAQYEQVRQHLRPDLQCAVAIEHEFGWRCQSEVLT